MSRFIGPLDAEYNKNGKPLDGAKFEFFEVGTANQKTTYADKGLTTPNSNPVIADASGRFPDIWLNGSYDTVLRDKNDVLIFGPKEVQTFISSGDGSTSIQALTTDEMVAIVGVDSGQIVETKEFSTGIGGGGVYDAVLTASVTPNAQDIIIGVANSAISFVLRKIYPLSANQFGVNASASDNQSAINRWLSFGGELTADPGVYITSIVTTVSNSHIYGTADVEFKLINSVDTDLFDTSGNSNTVIDGITINGNKANQTVDANAVCVRGASNVNLTVQGCIIKNSALTGINVTTSSNTRVINNHILDCGTENSVNSGDGVFLSQSTDDLIDGNHIINPARIGAVLKGDAAISRGGRITNNYFESTGENAISAEDGVENFLFSNNSIKTTGTSAFKSTGSGIAAGELSVSGEISYNAIQSAGSIGIELPNGPTNIAVHDNSIIDAGGFGIQALASDFRGGADNLSIQSNQIVNCGSDGIAIAAATTNPLRVANLNRDITILNNQIIDCGRDGIVAANMVGFSIDGNTIKDSVAFGPRVINSKDGSISFNVLDGTGSSGIYVQGSAINCRQLTVQGNQCIGCDTFGILLENSDNAAVMNNSIKNRSYEFTGTHDGAANAAVLTDTTASFATNSLVGYILYNITDGSNTTVTANTATTVTGVLSGGTEDDWDVSDVYELYTISKDATEIGVRSALAGNANLIVDNDVRNVKTSGVVSTVTGTADTVTPNFT